MRKLECDYCKKKLARKKLKRINSSWICKECKDKERKKHREYLRRKVLNIKKRKPNGTKNIPKIKGAKPKIKGSKYNHFYLTKDEKIVLYRKYELQGLVKDEIRNKIKADKKYLSSLIDKLKQNKKDNKEINRKFKEEFAKLIQIK